MAEQSSSLSFSGTGGDVSLSSQRWCSWDPSCLPNVQTSQKGLEKARVLSVGAHEINVRGEQVDWSHKKWIICSLKAYELSSFLWPLSRCRGTQVLWGHPNKEQKARMIISPASTDRVRDKQVRNASSCWWQRLFRLFCSSQDPFSPAVVSIFFAYTGTQLCPITQTWWHLEKLTHIRGRCISWGRGEGRGQYITLQKLLFSCSIQNSPFLVSENLWSRISN